MDSYTHARASDLHQAALAKVSGRSEKLVHLVMCLGTCIGGFCPAAQAAEDTNASEYARQRDVVYGRTCGMALTMDVFTPKNANGIGVLWVISSGGRSSVEGIDSPSRQKCFRTLLDRGYTVFAVVHRLQENHVPCRLVIKPGKGHGWDGWEDDTALIADWFDTHLRPESAAARPLNQLPLYGSNPEKGAYAQINGVRLYYERYGRGDPLLLLHGGTSHIARQGPLIDLLRPHTDLAEQDLKAIRCPVLISHGDRDTFVNLADIVWMYGQIPGANLYVAPNGGPGHHTDQIEAFGPILLRFLNRVHMTGRMK